jgi:hypothetical protein
MTKQLKLLRYVCIAIGAICLMASMACMVQASDGTNPTATVGNSIQIAGCSAAAFAIAALIKRDLI